MTKKNSSVGNVKSLMAVGVGGMAGLGVAGAMSNLPGMPAEAKSVTPILGAGVGLAAAGSVAKIGMGVAQGMQGERKRKSTGDRRLDKMLGH